MQLNKHNRFIDKDKAESISTSARTVFLPRHRWYYFKEGFSPTLVDLALNELDFTRKTVIDPFCGSGTVPLTCKLQNVRTFGYEINPFLAFLGNTKLLQVNPHTFELCLHDLKKAIEKGATSPLENISTFCESSNTDKWLFNREVLRGFEGGWERTNCFEPSERDLARLALISAAMDSCNAQKDGKCLRYRKNWKALAFNRETFFMNFTLRAKQILQDLEIAPISKTCEAIKLHDARKPNPVDEDFKFNLCVTSPPYLNSFDYSDVYRPELYLGKYVFNNEDLQSLRHKTIRSHVQVNWTRPKQNNFGEAYFSALEQIIQRSQMLWNKRLPMMIQAYFEDIMLVLRNLRIIADNNAFLWLVVSTSAYAGVEVPVDLIIANIGKMAGWEPQEVNLIRYLRSSGQHWNNYAGPKDEKPRLRESIIIFRAI